MKSTNLENQRVKIINDIVLDLNSVQDTKNSYAIQRNIDFFKAIKTKTGYLNWLFNEAPKIDGSKILELTDFAIPRWNRQMHWELINLEKRRFPGLIRPLVNRILNIITSQNKPLIVAEFGSGGMEVVRQVITGLLDKNYKQKLTFVGIDLSDVVHQIAIKNLDELKKKNIIEIFKVEKLDKINLSSLVNRGNKQYNVILCKNDLFKLPESFSKYTFDIIFHSLFKHHFNEIDKKRLELISKEFGKIILEYDGYKSWPHIFLPHSITGWHDPVFLNATIFSDLRYYTKKEIKNNFKKNQIRFFRIGTYLLEKNINYKK